jgi:hypothetical protein
MSFLYRMEVMATLSPATLASPIKTFAGPRGLVDQYFYFAMSLLFPVVVVWGFSRTVNESLFHPAIPRPLILWFHGATFFGWILFFLFQSALVRTRNVKWHRVFGWFGAALGAVMVPLGVATAIVMGRFDKYRLHQPGFEAFLIIPFYDMAAFGTLFALAVVWRGKPEMHRRLIFVASCVLLEAAFARFDFIFDHSLFPFCPDLLIGLGVTRDLVVNRRIHRVYLIALPVLIVIQSMVTLIWRGEAAWWVRIAHAILG